MSTIISAIINNIQAIRFMPIVKARIDKEYKDSPLVTEVEVAVQKILTTTPELKELLPRDEKALCNLSKAVYQQIRLLDLLKEGLIINEEGAAPLYSKAQKHMEQLMAEFTPKYVLISQEELKAHLSLLKPIIDDLLGSSEDKFKDRITMFAAGEIPHEDLVNFISRVVNKKENYSLRDTITSGLAELIEREISTEEDGAKWANDLSSLFQSAKELFTKEELNTLLKMIQDIPEREIGELISIAQTFLAESEGFSNIINMLILTLVEDRNVEQILAHFGLELKKIDDKASEKETEIAPSTQPKNFWQRSGKWIVGIGSGVLALVGGLSLTQDKGKGILFGIGTLGLGAVIASLFKPVRKWCGLPS